MPQSDVDLQGSKAKEISACLEYATSCQHSLFPLQGDLGVVDLYADTVELHKQWLEHLWIASVAARPRKSPVESLLAPDAEACRSQFVETASANKLAGSQAGDKVMAKPTHAFQHACTSIN